MNENENKNKSKLFHKPVLVDEVLKVFGIEQNAHLNKAGKYIDATLGHGGHSLEIAGYGSSVLGIETDEEMIKIAQERVKSEELENKIKIINGNFRDIDKIATENGYLDVDGILFDLGVSSYHFASDLRGFSFKNPNADLDMRLSTKKEKIKASDLLNLLREDQLADLFQGVLGKYQSERISRLMVEKRKRKSFKTVGDLLKVVEDLGIGKSKKVHPATKIFLALRIAVNGELDNVKEALPKAFNLLKKGGKMAVISFHSLEDSLVKEYFSGLVKRGLGRDIFGTFIKPSENEVSKNPLARSAILRAIEKI